MHSNNTKQLKLNNCEQIALNKLKTIFCIFVKPIHRKNQSYIVAGADLDNALVYVGSCDPDNISDNHVCSSDIGSVGSGPSIPFEVACPADTVGRYVYVWKNTNSATQFDTCGISVYGKEGKGEEEKNV